MTDIVEYTGGMVAHYATLLDERQREGPGLARMQETIIGLLRGNDFLFKAAQAEPQSLCDAVLSALNLGLSFQTSLGHAYLVPRSTKGRLQVCFQLGYRGLMELARRSGGVRSMQAELWWPQDRFRVRLGTDRGIDHEPDFTGQRVYDNCVGGYATATLASGDVDFEVMPRVEIERRRAVSQAKSGPWKDWPEEMARKTVLRALVKRLSLSVDAAEIIARDYRDDRPVAEGEVIDAEVEDAPKQVEHKRDVMPPEYKRTLDLARALPGGVASLDAMARAKAKAGVETTWERYCMGLPLAALPGVADTLERRITDVGDKWPTVLADLASRHERACATALEKLEYEPDTVLTALPPPVQVGLALHLLGYEKNTKEEVSRG